MVYKVYNTYKNGDLDIHPHPSPHAIPILPGTQRLPPVAIEAVTAPAPVIGSSGKVACRAPNPLVPLEHQQLNR